MFHTKEPIHLDIPGAFPERACNDPGLKGLSDAPVSKYFSYLVQMVEAKAQPAIPLEWPRDSHPCDLHTTYGTSLIRSKVDVQQDATRCS
jgi:hypothetical protein